MKSKKRSFSFFFLLLTAFYSLFLTGCVKRTILIESNPPGARAWINEHPVGLTPVTYEFITHGRYKFRLEKSGFRERTAREMVRAPVYEWIPLDFIFEHLVPFHLEDRHRFRYALEPEPVSEQMREEKPEDIQAYLNDLKSPDPERRRAALVQCASRRDPASIPAVEFSAQDPVPAVRGTALSALRALKKKESLPVLLQALERDSDPEVRWRAAIELEAAGDKEAVPALIQALEDQSPLVRAGAAEALKGIPDPRSVGPLVRTLRDKDTAARRAAAEALGLIGDRTAVPALARALFIHDFQTRRRAAVSLQKLKEPSSAPALVRVLNDWDPQIRTTATEALIEFGGPAVVPKLIRTLHSWKPVVREHAATALGGLKDSRAVEPLRKGILREPNETTRAAMQRALEQLQAVK
ncbi:MAG: HEAT repeat domain-containing protein [Candidatus Omnitrophica bacterium]|nr:HEAT repeat domain-containing protein [Candidatus Omnitrophota bacterium]